MTKCIDKTLKIHLITNQISTYGKHANGNKNNNNSKKVNN